MNDFIDRLNSLSVEPGKIPKPTKLKLGQLGINAADGLLFLRTITGQIVTIGRPPDLTNYATMQALTDGLAGKAPTNHGHQIAQVDGLQQTIDAMVQAIQGKQPVGNYATMQALTDGLVGKAPTNHGHQIAQVDGLQQTIDAMVQAIQGKQPVGNYATMQALTDGLVGKAPTNHGHQIAQVDGLQQTIDAMVQAIQGKQPVGNYATMQALTDGLVGKASVSGVAGNFAVTGNLSGNNLISSNYVAAGASSNFRVGTAIVMKMPNSLGWQAPTGPRSTASFNPNTVTLAQLAKVVAAIVDEGRYHGFLLSAGTTVNQ